MFRSEWAHFLTEFKELIIVKEFSKSIEKDQQASRLPKAKSKITGI